MDHRISLSINFKRFAALLIYILTLALPITGWGASFQSTPTVPSTLTVSIAAKPTSIASGSSSTLTVIATDAAEVMVTGSDGSKYTLSATGGTQVVKPTKTTIYTATATGSGFGGRVTAAVTVTVTTNPATT